MLPKGNGGRPFPAAHSPAYGIRTVAATSFARSLCAIRQNLREWDAFCQHVAPRQRKHLRH
jgi:hypothetical protein